MNRLVRSEELAELLAPMLRLPAHTLHFNLRAEAGRPVVVECQYALVDSPVMNGEFRTQIARYQLVQTPAPKSFDFDVWMAERRDEAHRQHMARGKFLSAIDEHIQIVNIMKASAVSDR